MRLFCLITLMLVARLAPAAAQEAGLAFTRFVDQTENAFAVDVPEGWTVHGGVMRMSAFEAIPWVVAVAPDGITQAFLGDPAVPIFAFPPTPGHPEGSSLPGGSLRPMSVLRHMSGAEFAATYGASNLAAVCDGVTRGAARGLPDLVERLQARDGVFGRHLEHDPALVAFTCTRGGARLQAGVLADTTVLFAAPPTPAWARLPPGAPQFPAAPPNLWSVPLVGGYVAPDGKGGLAESVLLHIVESRQFNPAWDDANKRAAEVEINRTNQEGEQARALMQQQSEAFTRMLLARGDAAQAQRMASHNASMAQARGEADARNAQFRARMVGKELNKRDWVDYALDRRLVCDRTHCWYVSTR